NAEKIISDGTSAGGAMSSLLGATGNHPVYEPYLQAMGAAEERDDILAAVCYCPITDLDHADMAYEWLYSCTNKGIRNLGDEQCALSEALAEQFPAYINSLGLTMPDGTPITDANYLDYVKSFLIRSIQRAVNEGCVIPEGIGIQMNMEPGWGPFPARPGEFVVDIDMPLYLAYIVSTIPLKMPPAFDSQGVLGSRPSRENEAFGDNGGSASNFTEYSLRASTGDDAALLPEEITQRAYMMNPMNFIGDNNATTAPHWYIRHGARDRDTSFPVPVNLATKLMNNGYDVDFALPWNRPHSGDYNLDDLFCWIARVTK
ncbi:MAG: alpha/beta hydrolase, partial [Bacteroidales bacterium]|nr:alpha/beta hydrolase [Bacteroidales bacterium]